MLSILTRYLLQYKRVCIPHIGTFELVQQSPHLDIADKQVVPPLFTTTYISLQQVPDHQLLFLCASGAPRERARADLFSFGEQLKSRIEKEAFCWNGFGSLRFKANELIFEPEFIRLESLQKIQAEKVMRQDAEHSMLVGDREMTSTEMITSLSLKFRRRSLVMVIGWILALIAFIAIIILLYIGKFQTTAAGLRTLNAIITNVSASIL